MEHLEFEFNGGSHSNTVRPYTVQGVVSSGNLEVLIEHKDLNGKCRFSIDTAAEGFGKTWEAVISNFMEKRQPADLLVSINDYAASPDIVSLRLDQAYEAISGGVK
ncbi:malonate decarboxylase acyl carrier protein [Lentisphaerota bacterium ZTH]|nr:malonate decarboxylase acyl carrier protein [Lentisphaerota bacterium]WET05374.1 malonate decarboxylase acyl carrier protein [Lentisphaerota bacterium ZTH]